MSIIILIHMTVGALGSTHYTLALVRNIKYVVIVCTSYEVKRTRKDG